MRRQDRNNRFRSVEKSSYRNENDPHENYIRSDEGHYNFDDYDDDYQRFSSSGIKRNRYPGESERNFYGDEDNFDPDDSYHERRESRNSGSVNRERHYFGNGSRNNYGASNNYGHGNNYSGNEYGARDNYENDEWDHHNYQERNNDEQDHRRGSWGGRLDSFYDEDIYDARNNDEHTMDSGRNPRSTRYNRVHANDSTHRYQNENAGNISDQELSGRNPRRSSRRSRNRRS